MFSKNHNVGTVKNILKNRLCNGEGENSSACVCMCAMCVYDIELMRARRPSIVASSTEREREDL